MILVAGSANLDFVVRVEHVPSAGETVLGQGFECFPGGKGANQAVASARTGEASTGLVLATGDDWLARPIYKSLDEAGIDIHGTFIADKQTGMAFICLAYDGQNAITVAPGANSDLSVEHLPELRGYGHLLLQLETPLPVVAALAQAARSQFLNVVLNAAPAQPLPADLLKLVDILIVNEGELAVITGDNASVVARMERLEVPIVIVTLGSLGCCARVNDKVFFEPGFPITAVDTTAAGDTFCGALVAALDGDTVFPEALRFANAAGAIACTRLGAQTSIPTKAAVLELLKDHRRPTSAKRQELIKYCNSPH